MVPAAEGDREFVARFAAQRAWLHVAQMMGIGWLAAANEARLLHDIAKVLAAAIAPRGRNREHALVDTLRLTSVGSFGGAGLLRARNPGMPEGPSFEGPAESDDGSSDSLRSKASSSSLASSAVRLFFATSDLPAQVVARSADAMFCTSITSLSRSCVDRVASRMTWLLLFVLPRPRPLSVPCGWPGELPSPRCQVRCGPVDEDSEVGPAHKSGASMSSSPAMPTSVNRAYRPAYARPAPTPSDR